MPKSSRISAAQLTVLLLASRLSGCLLLTNQAIGRMPFADSLLSIAFNGVLLFFLCLPTLWVGGTLNRAYGKSRRLGRVVGILYLLLCVFLLCIDVLQFHDFAEKVMKSELSVPLLTASLVVVAFLASWYGVGALARAALPVAVFSLACLLVFGLSLIPEMRHWYFPVGEQRNALAIVRTAVADLPRTAEITVLGLLLPAVNQKRGRAVFAFTSSTSLITAGITATALSVLGDFALHTAYPYYTAATAAQIGVFERMDMLIVAVWLATFFVRITLFACAFTTTARRVCSRFFGVLTAVGAAVPCAVALLLPTAVNSAVITTVYWCVLGAFCVGLPCILRRRRV